LIPGQARTRHGGRPERCKLSCANLNGECQFHAKSHELIGAFLAFSPDCAQDLLLSAKSGLPLHG